jgi:hypothetical protein
LEQRARRANRSTAQTTLTVDEQADIDSLLHVADLLWEAKHDDVPPLEQDPTAIMLGLVSDPAITLDGQAVKTCRMRAGLGHKELAACMAARGWEITTKDVFSWETKTVAGVCPALIRAVAEELGVEESTVTAHAAISAESVIDRVQAHPKFAPLAGWWAEVTHVSDQDARRQLASRMVATANRGSDLDEEQWLDMLSKLIQARMGQSGQ